MKETLKEKLWGSLVGDEKKAMRWKDGKEGVQEQNFVGMWWITHMLQEPHHFELLLQMMSHNLPPSFFPFLSSASPILLTGIPLFFFSFKNFPASFLLSCTPPLSLLDLCLYCFSCFLFLLLFFRLPHSTVCVNIIQESHGCAILIRLAGASLFLVVTPL